MNGIEGAPPVNVTLEKPVKSSKPSGEPKVLPAPGPENAKDKEVAA